MEMSSYCYLPCLEMDELALRSGPLLTPVSCLLSPRTAYVRRYSDLRPSRRGTRALGCTQPDTRVRWCPWVGHGGVPGGAASGPPGAAALVAGRGGVLAPEHHGAAGAGIVRQAGGGTALAGGCLTWGAGGGRRSGGHVLPTSCGCERPRSGAAGSGPSTGSAGGNGGRLDAAGVCRLRCGPLAGGVEAAPDWPGLGEALHIGRPLEDDAAGAGDGSAAGCQQQRGRARRRRPSLSECGCAAPGVGLGVALAGRRAGRCPAAPAHRAATRGAGGPGVGVPTGAPPRGRRGERPSGGRHSGGSA